MKRIVNAMPSPAMCVSIVALIVAMGGSSYAAVQLSRDSVGARHIKTDAVRSAEIKENAVRSAEVKDFSLLSKDFKPGEVPAGPRGLPGPAGATGPAGTVGPPGPGGSDGSDGTDGTDGVDGVDGSDGEDGEDGTGLTLANVYGRTGENADGSSDAEAECDPGDVVTGGGGRRAFGLGSLNASAPVPDPSPTSDPTGWFVRADSGAPAGIILAYVLCIDTSP